MSVPLPILEIDRVVESQLCAGCGACSSLAPDVFEMVDQSAAADGYLVLKHEDPTLHPRSQPNIFSTRGRLWGQLTTLRLLGVPVPQYRGFPTFGAWLRVLGLRAKLQSTFGTVRRARQRGLLRRAMAPRADSLS